MFEIVGMQPGGGGFPFQFLFWFIPIVFTIVFGIIIFTVVRNVLEWSSNNKKPVEKEKAKVMTKRENVRRSSGGRRQMSSRTSTTYYVTFELENSDRKEFRVKGNEYGTLAEGDVGYLTFQGTRYHEFERVTNLK